MAIKHFERERIKCLWSKTKQKNQAEYLYIRVLSIHIAL